MPVFRTSVAVAHTADNMFELVSDFRHYPDFIRWFQSMRVTGEREVDGVRHSVGEAAVGFRGFSGRFTTRVSADPSARRVEANLVRGPFRHLQNVWEFTPEEDGTTRIDCMVDYEFSNFILRMLAKNNFHIAVDRIMDAFLAEADRRYPRVTPTS